MRIALTGMPLWAALLPLSAYLAAMGILQMLRRPVVLSGQTDVALLASGLGGMVIAGPLALLQPAAGMSAWTTVVLLLGFVLVVGFAMLAARPRMVVYNVRLDQMRPLVAAVAAALDPSVRWAGETAALPARGLQVQLDDRGPGRTVSIIAAGRSPAETWSEFARRLRRGVRSVRVGPSPWAWGFLAAAAVLAGIAARLAFSG